MNQKNLRAFGHAFEIEPEQRQIAKKFTNLRALTFIDMSNDNSIQLRS